MLYDIKLSKNEDNTYDWTFNNGDIETVSGEQRLINATKHAILLKRQELRQTLYKGKGCDAQDYIKDASTNQARRMCEESITLACKEIRGVKDAITEVSSNTDEIQIHNLTLIKNNGEEVDVHEI